MIIMKLQAICFRHFHPIASVVKIQFCILRAKKITQAKGTPGGIPGPKGAGYRAGVSYCRGCTVALARGNIFLYIFSIGAKIWPHISFRQKYHSFFI